jgi:hypothetical protein
MAPDNPESNQYPQPLYFRLRRAEEILGKLDKSEARELLAILNSPSASRPELLFLRPRGDGPDEGSCTEFACRAAGGTWNPDLEGGTCDPPPGLGLDLFGLLFFYRTVHILSSMCILDIIMRGIRSPGHG